MSFFFDSKEGDAEALKHPLKTSLRILAPLAKAPDALIFNEEYPILSKDRTVNIRPFRPNDAPLLFDAVHESVHDLCRYMTWCHPDYSLADSREFVAKSDSDWKKGEQYNFAIVDGRDEALVGAVGINRIDRANRSANIGYWVRRTRTRCGIATAALPLLVRYGLKELGFHRLEVLVPVHNPASRRVAEKAGARFEGLLRNRVAIANEIHDAFLYSFIPEDVGCGDEPAVRSHDVMSKGKVPVFSA